jgi:penicillin V acylase-like amidase (Ntn superfamily)
MMLGCKSFIRFVRSTFYKIEEEKMKKLASALFVLMALMSNVTFANDDCHDGHDHKEHCDKH